LRVELDGYDKTTGTNTIYSAITINTNKDVAVCAVSKVQAKKLARLPGFTTGSTGFTSWSTVEEGATYKLPVLYYGKLVSGAVEDCLGHEANANDLFNVSTNEISEGTQHSLSYSTNTLWSTMPSYSCFRPAYVTSNINYLLFETDFPQLV
jgi:hypothetical protein